MLDDLALTCTCGAMRGVIRQASPNTGAHVVCYCNDCQAFAHFLGRADEILDPSGGTEIFQVTSKHLELRGGHQHLACMRLGPRGLMRWYASCCRTPLANTVAKASVPFIGIIVSLLEPEPKSGPPLAPQLGPIKLRVHGRDARGPVRGGKVYAGAPLRKMLPVFGRLFAARLRGEHRDSPFFDPATGEPWAKPQVLTLEERRALERSRDARSSER
ncbi:DUF6151 family protein [Haliangium ochraceum]|uniref:CENP-V/GFA domain-containing protein n=1 Tax=Haliangium ochraceum (strain DSM 14365 / JCM 11303 / SMP-2) TaxID=502025 RepID=D0LZN5_HALO1|nr:DUF6151 family protein [Haliangium ochraceum]ACY18014.1 conserved hypothetical protein [Haliangium ochraceum DSM 14365]